MTKYILIALTICIFLTACSSNENIGTTTEQTESVPENTELTKETTNQETNPPVKEEIEEESTPVIEETEPIIEEAPEPQDEDLVEIIKYIPDIIIDLKYATTDNFTRKIIYEDNIALLRYGTVKKLISAQDELRELGYTLVIWDAYRPIEAQFKLWEVYPDSKYVANPNNGYSSHNRGNTVDITIRKISGEKVEMPTEFDDFSVAADRNYSDVSEEAKNNSLLLENLMIKYGFKPYSTEWWHYSDTVNYDVVK